MSSGPIERLTKIFTKKEIQSSLKELYDAFIRDEVSSGLRQDLRVQVHEVYRAFEELVEGLEE